LLLPAHDFTLTTGIARVLPVPAATNFNPTTSSSQRQKGQVLSGKKMNNVTNAKCTLSPAGLNAETCELKLDPERAIRRDETSW